MFELGVYIDEALLSVSFCMGEKVGPHSLPFSVTVLFPYLIEMDFNVTRVQNLHCQEYAVFANCNHHDNMAPMKKRHWFHEY